MSNIKNLVNSELEQINKNITSILISSESEFLAVGTTIENFTDILNKINTECSNFISSIMGHTTDVEVNKLRSLLGDLQKFIEHSNTSYYSVVDGVSSIATFMKSLEGVVIDFKNEHSLLKYLNFSVKKESAKIDSNESKVFNLLSKNIEDLAYALEQSLAKILDFIRELTREITITDKIDLQGNEKATFDQIYKGLNSMITNNGELTSAIESIGSKFIEIEDYISQVIVSLQKHDIIRQQFEHILESFDFVKQRHEELNDEEYEFFIQKVFLIQLAQIDNSRNEIIEAKNAIEASIDGIHVQVSEMNPILSNLNKHNSSKLTLASNPLHTVEEGIKNITTDVTKIKTTEAEFLTSIESVNKKVKDLNSFINEIEEISSDIKLISFNSQIASLHIGDMGRTLRVISDEIGSYTYVVAKKSTSISDSIKDIINNSDKLSTNIAEEGANGENESKLIINKTKYSIDFFSNINKTFFKSLNMLSDENDDLIGNINIMKQGLQLDVFIETIDNVQRTIEGILDQLPEIPDKSMIREDLLNELINSYTMNSERRVFSDIMSTEHNEDMFEGSSEEGELELF